MSVLMQIVGLVNGESTPYDGQYLVAYDPERDGLDPNGDIMSAYMETTPDPEHAHHFTDHVEAMECWRQVCQRAPMRPDGRPNRPLTAFSVEITRAH